MWANKLRILFGYIFNRQAKIDISLTIDENGRKVIANGFTFLEPGGYIELKDKMNTGKVYLI